VLKKYLCGKNTRNRETINIVSDCYRFYKSKGRSLLFSTGDKRGAIDISQIGSWQQ